MKTYNENVIGNILAGDGRLTTSERNCPNKCLSAPLAKGQVSRTAVTSTDRIEKEVNELLSNNTAALSRYAVNMAWDKTIVQDAIQEAFLRYFVARIGGQQMENPRAWLFRVLRNYILDCNRKLKTSQAVNLEEAVQVADSRQDAETGYQQSEILRRALSSLSPREQECMQLRVEGFGYEEIAHVLRIQPGTVGALLARGLKKIRGTDLFSRRQRCFDRSSEE